MGILRERLKYALNKREVMMICMQKLIKIDGRVRTDPTYPCGFMDVVTIERSNDMFRLMYDTKGRYVLHRIRYPDPLAKVNDTVKVSLSTGKIVEIVKFEMGTVVTVTKGRNCGRVGVLQSRDKHPGSFDILHVKDATGNTFATRMENVFVVGQDKPLVSWPKAKGIKLDIFQEKQALDNKE